MPLFAGYAGVTSRARLPTLLASLANGKGKLPQRTKRDTEETPLWTSVSSVVSGLVFAVDLRFLQFIGVVDIDRLPLGVEVNRADAALAVSVASGFGTAEGQMDLRANRRGIDVGDAGIQIANRGEGLVYIFRVDSRREAVLDSVGDFDGVFHAIA